jgi:hypothetical protein
VSRQCHDFVLEDAALLADLAEAGGEQDRALHLAPAAFLDHRLDGVRSSAHHSQVELARCIGDRRIGREAEDFRLARIDRDDRAGVSVGDQRLDRTVAALDRVLRGADDQDRAWVEDTVEIVFRLWRWQDGDPPDGCRCSVSMMCARLQPSGTGCSGALWTDAVNPG